MSKTPKTVEYLRGFVILPQDNETHISNLETTLTETNADLAAALELLREAREWIDHRSTHAMKGKECKVCKFVERIDALLNAAGQESRSNEADRAAGPSPAPAAPGCDCTFLDSRLCANSHGHDGECGCACHAAPAAESVAVPEFPTEEMQIAGMKAANGTFAAGFIVHIWKEMLAAAKGEKK